MSKKSARIAQVIRGKGRLIMSQLKAALNSALIGATVLIAFSSVQAANQWLDDEPEFLPADEAFRLSAQLQSDRTIVARWEMPSGYYLYRHQFGFNLTGDESGAVLAEARIPPGKSKVDEFFGEVEVYYSVVEINLPLIGRPLDGAVINIKYQGCADAGLCYPPESKVFTFTTAGLLPGNSNQPLLSSALSQSLAGPSTDAQSPLAGRDSSNATAETEDQELAGVLSDASYLGALAIFFLAGIGLAFTPCVFPMVPILSSIIVGEGQGLSKSRAFTLSLSYVLGMALTYALVGLLVGLFGAELNLQAKLQSPLVLIAFALVFVGLAGSMFGFYDLALPQGLQQWLGDRSGAKSGGRYPSVFVMGSLSSLVVSPCISAPLAGALIYLSNTSDVVLGGSALFALGLGLGVPRMVVGSSGGHWLPRAGQWMNLVKGAFGVGLLGVAIWLLERLVPGSVALALWAILLVGSGVFLGALDFASKTNGAKFTQMVGLILLLWGALCLVGAASGAVDPFQPLNFAQSTGGNPASAETDELPWQPVKSVEQVQGIILASEKPVMLDLYADWCISCKTMERKVFPAPEVAALMKQYTLVKADVTANDEIDRALLKHFGLFGPPSMVFFAEDGSEIEEFRVQGEVNIERLAAHLRRVLADERT
jgi:thiol:disulfide interchange protein DsbD